MKGASLISYLANLIMIASADGVKVRQPVKVGNILRLEVRFVRKFGNFFIFSGQAFVGKEMVAAVKEWLVSLK